MSRYSIEMDTESILRAAEHWKTVALLGNESVFSSDSLWTLPNLAELDQHFVSKPDKGKGKFYEKLELQLADAEPGARQLVAEMLWFMFLCPSNISSSNKRENIKRVWEWSDEPFPANSEWVADKVLNGVGSAGQAYNQHRWLELAFFIRTVATFKNLSKQRQSSLLADGWEFARWIEEIPGCSRRQLRNMIAFLLFPDKFESIFGGSDRKDILKVFLEIAPSQFSKLSALEVDQRLFKIREQKEKEYSTRELDFYSPPLKGLWKDSIQPAWLFSWRPENWDWDSLDDDRAVTHGGGTVKIRWACANGKVSKGDTAYLVKVGKPPKGIMAIGRIVSEPYEARHWDERKAETGKVCQFVDIAFSRIQNPHQGDPYITESDLIESNESNESNQTWFPQTTGIEIKSEHARGLDKLWKKVVESKTMSVAQQADSRTTEATNKIFYGPPGTGKTYRLNLLIKEYSGGEHAPNKEAWLIQEMQETSWFDVIFATLHNLGKSGSVGSIKDHEYIQAKSKSLGRTRHISNTLWGVLQLHTHEDSTTVRVANRSAPQVFNKLENGVWVLAGNWREECSDQVELAQRWQRGPNQETASKRFEFVTFHQAFSYEDFVEGIRPVEDVETGNIGYRVVPGVFKRICELAEKDPGQRYAMFIDEINRGNIAKIFGELITLIEPDKRAFYNDDGSLKSGIEVTLPYSGDRFGVPRNLDIFGTMNTADRSIAQLDTALRRRFQFEELMPYADLIDGIQGGGLIEDGMGGEINLRKLLKAMNNRIRFLLNRDMTLGHAYFIDIREFSDLEKVLRQQVIPLLQEYFYDNWHRIQLVFRDVGPAKKKVDPQIVCHGSLNKVEILGYDHEDYEDSTQYWIADNITPDAIRKVYEEDL